jgi:DNA-directed RNA polymerase specialized sigma subunit
MAEEKLRIPVREIVIDYLEKHKGKTLTVREISAETALSEKAVRRALRQIRAIAPESIQVGRSGRRLSITYLGAKIEKTPVKTVEKPEKKVEKKEEKTEEAGEKKISEKEIVSILEGEEELS